MLDRNNALDSLLGRTSGVCFMITIQINISTNPVLKDPSTLLAATAAAMADQIKKAVSDIRDPATGEGPKITLQPNPEGMKVIIEGSDFVRTKAERRLSELRGHI